MDEHLRPIAACERGDGPLVATAIHHGHQVREELQPWLALEPAERMREEDPFTGEWTQVASSRVVGHYSRFEVDLNRPREKAVYRTPADAWGLKVWHDELPEDLVERSLSRYDSFYRELEVLYGELEAAYGKFVVLDLHTYNHRRQGPDGPHADRDSHPQVNVGTGTMADRERWGRVIDRFLHELRRCEFPGGPLDVRENVKFFGGHCPRWTHARFPQSACVLSVEFKKFFMDEWTGLPDPDLMAAIPAALQATLPGLMEEVERVR